MIAFGIRDVCWGLMYSAAVWDLWSGSYAVTTDPTDNIDLVYALGTFEERALLGRFRDTLGISAADAATLKGELQAKNTPAAAVPGE